MQLEIKRHQFNQLEPSANNQAIIKVLDALSEQIKDYRLNFSNQTIPSSEKLNTLMQTLNNALEDKNLTEHRGFLRKTPIFREVVMGIRIGINAVQFALEKIARQLTGNKEPVHKEGLSAILKQPDTSTIEKMKAFKKDLTDMTKASDNTPKEPSNTTSAKPK